MSSVNVSQREGEVVLCFQDRELVGDEQILRVVQELTEVLESTSSGTRMLLDFQNVQRVATLMLGDLVALNKMALKKGVLLQFCGLSPQVVRVIKTCQLDRLFEILEDPPSAAT